MGDTFDSKNTQLDGVTVQPKSDVEHLNDFISTMTSGGRAQLVAEHDGIKKCERHITYFSVNTEVSNTAVVNYTVPIFLAQSFQQCPFVQRGSSSFEKSGKRERVHSRDPDQECLWQLHSGPISHPHHNQRLVPDDLAM